MAKKSAVARKTRTAKKSDPAKRGLGSKRVCGSCGCYFYDMRKSQPACPRCGTVVTASSGTARRPALVEEEAGDDQTFDPIDSEDVDAPPAGSDEVTAGGLKDIAVDQEGQIVGDIGAASDDEDSDEDLDMAEDEDEKSPEEGDEDAEDEDEI